MRVLRDASEAIHFQRTFLWRNKKWRVLDETLSTSIFVARLKRRIFNECLSGAFQTNHFPRECLWRFSASPGVPSFPRSCSPFEMQLEGKKVVLLVSMRQILTKKKGYHKFWVTSCCVKAETWHTEHCTSRYHLFFHHVSLQCIPTVP